MTTLRLLKGESVKPTSVRWGWGTRRLDPRIPAVLLAQGFVCVQAAAPSKPYVLHFGLWTNPDPSPSADSAR
jgi:hypothetical protein